MGTHPIFESDFDCLTEKKMEEFHDAEEDIEFEPSLYNVLNQKSLKWIFVGGKGGVGKTSTSCSLAVLMSKVREKVLLISTDPAHNISDSFDQKFSKVPTKVNGFDNLFAMEIDPNVGIEGLPEEMLDEQTGLKKMMSDFAQTLPGVDEAVSFSEVMKLINDMQYSCVIFDTAPTGHTLRLLNFPGTVESGIGKILGMFEGSNGFGPMMNMVKSMLNVDLNADFITDKLGDILPTVRKMKSEFEDPNLTTFICVCIAEFLSLYETERLIQELAKINIDSRNIVVNRLVPCENAHNCKTCKAQTSLQQKYLEQIEDLYCDFHITKVPLFETEVRGIGRIHTLCNKLCPGMDSSK